MEHTTDGEWDTTGIGGWHSHIWQICSGTAHNTRTHTRAQHTRAHTHRLSAGCLRREGAKTESIPFIDAPTPHACIHSDTHTCVGLLPVLGPGNAYSGRGTTIRSPPTLLLSLLPVLVWLQAVVSR